MSADERENRDGKPSYMNFDCSILCFQIDMLLKEYRPIIVAGS